MGGMLLVREEKVRTVRLVVMSSMLWQISATSCDDRTGSNNPACGGRRKKSETFGSADEVWNGEAESVEEQGRDAN